MLVDSVVETQSRQSIRQTLIHDMIRRVDQLESETQLDTALELVDVLVCHALAPVPVLALVVPLAPQPRLVAVRVW